jgi:hypothetical protein
MNYLMLATTKLFAQQFTQGSDSNQDCQLFHGTASQIFFLNIPNTMEYTEWP